MNATASVPGILVYSPTNGTVLNAGNAQPLSAVFHPTDTINYVATTNTVFLNVAQAPLTITATANTKNYDGTTSATAKPIITSGVLQGSDTANFIETYDNKSVGTGKTLTPSGTVNDGHGGANYALTFASTANGTITTFALTVGAKGVDKVYDGTTTATVILSDNRVSGDNLTETYTSATFADKNVGTAKTVNVSGISVGGPDGPNYTFNTTATTTANITPATLMVTANSRNKIYGQTVSFLGTEFTTSGLTNGDTVTSVSLNSSGSPATAGAAGSPYSIVPSAALGTGLGNYAISYHNGTLTVNQATLMIASGITANNKVYDGNTTATLNSNNVVLAGILNGDASNVSLVTNGYTATFAAAAVGNNIAVTVSNLTISGSAATNYALSQPAGLTASITKAAVTIASGLIADNKVYDATTTATLSSNNVVLTGIASEDTANVWLITNGYTAVFAGVNAGNNVGVTVNGLTLGGSASGNYTLSQPSGLTANLAARALTVTAVSNTKSYDGTTSAAAIPSITSGVLQGSDTANFTETYDNRNIGTGKTLTPLGKVNDGNGGNNYTYTFDIAAGAINPLALTVAAAPNTTNYNGTTSALARPIITSGALQASDTANFTETYDNKNVGTAKTLTPSGIVNDGNGGANYSVTFVPQAIGTITPGSLTISALGVNKVYDGTTSATVDLFDNRVPGDNLTASYSSASFADKSVGPNKTVTVIGISVSGTDASNYTNNSTTTTTANITAAGVSIPSGITANNKPYDGTTTATLSSNSVALAGVLVGDAASVGISTNGYTASFASAGAGTGKSVSVSGLTLTGSAASNYALTQPSLTANITSAGVSISSGLAANNKTYDGSSTATLSSNSVVLAGIVSGDGAKVWLVTNGYTATFTSAAAGNNIAVTVSNLTLGGSAATNYTLTQPASLSASITVAPVTIASGIIANNKVYDASTPATLSSNNVVLAGIAGVDTTNVWLVTNGYTAVFTNKNSGNNVGVKVSGLALGGSDSTNYNLSQPSGLTANITARPLPVTAAPNTKVYDATNSAAAIPTIPSGALQGNDTVNFTETYDNKNVGTGKTLTPSARSTMATAVATTQ